jgi:glycosyltransferase involved in cell wall biosynthesis
LFFSVITPSWNQGEFLARCLECVQRQGSDDYEHLVFDNCSTDASAMVAADFPCVRFVREADRGQSHAVNKGLAAARGEIICWLNADDAYPAGVFTRLRELFADPQCDVVFGDVEQVAYDGRPPQRAAAVALTGTVNILATVASAGVAAFQLPSAEASPEIVVENDGASSALVFAAGATETINALSAGASFSVTNAKPTQD